jgi:putative ABC transport system permease protein
MKSKKKKPPALFEFLLKKLEKGDEQEALLGDYTERYYTLLNKKGSIVAASWYTGSIFFLFILKTFNLVRWSLVLVKNYVLVTLRNMNKYKTYSLINISGLSIGIAFFMLIFLFVQNELSYDKFNVNIDRIYRLQGENDSQPSMCPAIGNQISKKIPEILKTVRIKPRGDYLLQYRSTPQAQLKKIKLPHFLWVDAELFDIFTLNMIKGDPKTALKDPYSLVLTNTIAARTFGEKNPVGKQVLINGKHRYKVTGIVEDPKQFHITFNALASFNTLGKIIGRSELDSFNSWNLATYILLPEIHNKDVIAQKITQLFAPQLKKLYNTRLVFELRPLKYVYFSSIGYGKRGNLQFVSIFMGVAIFVLLVACFNFINLATARGALRAREVGLRKVVGSSRSLLVIQFIGESCLYSMLSWLIALAIVTILLPAFSGFIGESLDIIPLINLPTLLKSLIGIFLVGFISGCYPAFVLSSYQPCTVIQGQLSRGHRRVGFRKFLIVVQFSISIILLIGTFTVYRQLSFLKNKDLGFKKHQVVLMDLKSVRQEKSAFRHRLLENPSILNVSFSQGYPSRIYNWESFHYQGERVGFAVFTVDPEYFELYGLKLKEGRLFSRQRQHDQIRTCIMNETAVKAFGLSKPVGTIFHRERWGTSSFPAKAIEVVGVVKDFHIQSLHHEIAPLLFSWNEPWLWMASIRIAPKDISNTMTYIKNTWEEFSSDFPFEYRFLDDRFNQLYHKEERFGKLFSYLAGIGLFISALGLLGLSAFIVLERIREIGIRKVLGASGFSIVSMLTRKFIYLVIVANMIAWPIGFLAMNYWLRNFAYRTAIGLFPFVSAAVIALLLALFTVSIQTLKGANANPVDVLKYQ